MSRGIKEKICRKLDNLFNGVEEFSMLRSSIIVLVEIFLRERRNVKFDSAIADFFLTCFFVIEIFK